MWWADEITLKIKERFGREIKAGKPIIIRDEKTASGRVHVGSLRGVAIHGVISEVLSEEKIANKFLYEINDFDPMDGLPVYLDQEKFRPFMGKPLCEVPSPDGKAKNYAEYFGDEFAGVISELGFKPEFYRASDFYKRGDFNDCIRLALVNADKIRNIYKKISGSQKEEKWLPVSVICEKCGKVGTTRASDFNGKEVSYTCGDYVEWAKGCGHSGRVSPFDGKAKLPWKVEWAAKFKVFGVMVEGGGKDHSTKGGSREIADAISREVFGYEPPINIPYEFIQAEGRKMSSSKGKGASSREVADLLPPEILRLLLLQKDPKRVVEFIPDGDTVPILYDAYDRFALNYWSGVKDDFAHLFHFVEMPKRRGKNNKRALPRFSIVAYLTQMPHIDTRVEVEKLLGHTLEKKDLAELKLREKYAKIWLETYAPEDYRFEIQSELPISARNLSTEQKSALKSIAEFLASEKKLDGQILHAKLHDLKEVSGMNPEKFFTAIYLSILGKESGPKAGWFLSVLDKEFLIKRFREASQT